MAHERYLGAEPTGMKPGREFPIRGPVAVRLSSLLTDPHRGSPMWRPDAEQPDGVAGVSIWCSQHLDQGFEQCHGLAVTQPRADGSLAVLHEWFVRMTNFSETWAAEREGSALTGNAWYRYNPDTKTGAALLSARGDIHEAYGRLAMLHHCARAPMNRVSESGNARQRLEVLLEENPFTHPALIAGATALTASTSGRG